MNYRNAAVVSVLASVMAGCAYLPTGHSSRSSHANAIMGKLGAETDQLFVNDRVAPTGVAASADTPPVSGLRVRKSKRGNMESYVVRGQRYFTLGSSDGYSARGLASWYGPNFHGRTASNGEVYDMYKMTAAHKTLPLPTYARVTHLDNGKSIIVKINDRGPFSGDRLIDLSFSAALELGMVNDGTAMVEIQALSPEELVTLSGPTNTLGVEFYYDAGPEKKQSLPASELFVADSKAVLDETVPALNEGLQSVGIEQHTDGPLNDVQIVDATPESQTVDQFIVPLDSLLAADASPALPADGAAVDISALDSEYLQVVVPDRQEAAESARLLAAAERELAAVPQSLEVATLDTQSIAGSKAQPQRVPVPLFDGAALGQTLPTTTVPAMATAKSALPVSDNRYYIQAGVFADVRDAEKVAVDIVLEIPGEEVHVKPLKDSRMYRITVGPIVSGDHAKQVSTRLNTAGIENYTVKVKEI